MLSTKNKWAPKYYWGAVIVTPILIISVLFILMNIAPFGVNNLLVSDLSTQYLQFFTELRRQLLHLSFSSYSFLISIGDSLVPIYAYYLLSPLNLIIVFFSNAHLPIAIDLIIWAKIILCNITMSTFLAKKYQRYDFMTICGGLAYGLCGFVAMYFYDLMWLDALIWLPVMIYGLEKLFYQNRVWLYVFGLVMIIVTNYYMGYIICGFSVMYFVYLLKKNQPVHLKFWQAIHQQRRKVGRFIWYSVISGMLTAIVLVPTALSMLSTGKKNILPRNFAFKGTFGPSFTVNLGVGGNDFTGRLVHNPSLFTGSLFIIAAIAYFFSNQISKRDKQASGLLLGVILFGMWLLPLNTIWHMMQRPAGFPFRMVFLFSFVLIMVAYEGYIKGVFKDQRLIIYSAVGLGTAIFIGYVWATIFGQKLLPYQFKISQLSVNNFVFLLVVGLIGITAFEMIQISAHAPGSKVIMVLILAFEMCLNFLIATRNAPFINQHDLERSYQHASQLIGKVEQREQNKNRFYRMVVIDQPFREVFNRPNMPYSGYNDALIFHNRGVSSYSSTLNSNTHHVLASLGFSSRNIRRIDMLGGSVITNHLFGIRYYYLIGKHQNRLIVRKNAAQLGFMVNDRMQHLKFKRGQVFDNLNRFVQAEAGDSGHYLEQPQVTSYQQKTFRDFYQYKMKIQATTSGPHYLYIPRVRLHGVKIIVNGAVLSSLYSGLGTEMIPLGYLQKHQVATITLQSVKQLRKPTEDVAGINIAKFERVVQLTDQHQFKLDDVNRLNEHGGHFRGVVHVGKRNRTLLLSIPYDQGWQVRVDGKQHPIKKVASGLIGTQLTPGKHRLAFNYHIRGLLAGAFLSSCGLVLMLGSIILRMKRHNL
ncbi:MAG: YfhO family protein [Lentilactobacillus diolivorans]|jgi:uncharacterized membrane protein YfhO|nr:YfhO family protein [Lentilactobacillus diolivorans]RRG02739.1 MAG: hypothetical protein DUD34_07645 [Lactobacillus sp.]